MSKYKFETIKEDYSHYGSGNVFASAPGNPGFPVRLAAEVFQGCLALMPALSQKTRFVLYDPCCGAGYLLATVGYRHWRSLQHVVGSDPDDQVLRIAQQNLSMLKRAGLLSKLDFLSAAQASEWRQSRDFAVRSIQYFLDRLSVLEESNPLDFTLFQADAGSAREIVLGMQGIIADIVIADVPYGGLSQWKGTLANAPSRELAITMLLESIRPVLSTNAVVAIVSPKKESVVHPLFARRRKLKLGKRIVTFLSLVPPA